MIYFATSMMIYTLPYKTKQFFFQLIKISIVVASFYFIYVKLANNKDLEFSTFIAFLTKNDILCIKNITFLMFLSIFNWFFEILKWQVLVSEIKKTNFKTALEQSLGALTASLFTPNRIGEYGAKAIYYKKAKRKQILLVNLIGNMMQMAVTCIFGAIGFAIFISKYQLGIDFKILILSIIIVFFVFLVIGFLIKSDISIRGFSLKKLKIFLETFRKKKMVLAFMYAFIRYGIFSFQFYFLLVLFNVDISYFDAMIVISSMYLLSSIIPSIFIFDVLIKGSVALYLFTFMGVGILTILSITTLMWLFNFVLPSIAGSYYVLNFKFPKENNAP